MWMRFGAPWTRYWGDCSGQNRLEVRVSLSTGNAGCPSVSDAGTGLPAGATTSNQIERVHGLPFGRGFAPMGINAVAYTAAAATTAAAVASLATIATFGRSTRAVEFVDVGTRATPGSTGAWCTARAPRATIASIAPVARYEGVARHLWVGCGCVGPRNKEGEASTTTGTASTLRPSAATTTAATAAGTHVMVSRVA